MTTMPPIALYLVTGFLGSGKTTLLKGLLSQPAMAGTAVIVNEYGAVGIDNAVFAETLESDKIFLLANGCLCCSAGDDLVRTLLSLTELPIPPTRIVVETTGIADPGPVLQRLISDPRVSNAVRIAGVVTTIDAVLGLETLENQPVAVRQAAVADRRIVTKSDIAPPDQVDRLVERLQAINPGAALTFVNHGETNADELLKSLAFDPYNERLQLDAWFDPTRYRRGSVLGHADGRELSRFSSEVAIRSWLLESEKPLDWSILSDRLGQVVGRYGDVILRLKGVIFTASDSRPLVLHAVQRLFHPPVRLATAHASRTSSIVIVGDGRAAGAAEATKAAMVDAGSFASG